MKAALRTIGLAAGGAVALLLPGERAGGFGYYALGPDTVVWPFAESVRFLSPTSFPPGSITELLYLTSMGQWSDVPGCEFQYFFVTNPQDFPIDHFDGYSDTIAVPANQLDPGVLALTYLVNDGPAWYDMDTLFADFPPGAGWSFEPQPDCELIADPSTPNGFVFLLVALHELGHGIGLAHDPVGDEAPGMPFPVATLNPFYPMGGTMGQESIVELHADDRNGARFLYPHSGPSGPLTRDLASASYAAGHFPGVAVPLFFDPVAAAPGETISARSSIENLGNSNQFSVHQGFYLSPDDVIEAGDMLIGAITWDLPLGDAVEFDAILTLPEDLPAGLYFLGSFLDDDNHVAELYEDNNAALYCTPLVVSQLAPEIELIPQQQTVVGVPFVGPAPVVTHPLNMAPIAWSLLDEPAGMTIHPQTGVVSWTAPVKSPFPYEVILRATNGAGSGTQFMLLGVSPEPDDCASDCAPGGGDLVVDIVDLLSVIAEWGSQGPFDCDAYPRGGDGVVGIQDLLKVISDWGPCP